MIYSFDSSTTMRILPESLEELRALRTFMEGWTTGIGQVVLEVPSTTPGLATILTIEDPRNIFSAKGLGNTLFKQKKL